MTTLDCFLCGILPQAATTLPWHDRVLMSRKGIGYAVPALGALAPGHVLVVPEGHWTSTSTIFDGAHDFSVFATQVLRRVEVMFGPTTVFEHGTCSEDIRRSACVTHAHLQMIPGIFSLATLADTSPRCSLRSLAEFIGSGREPRGYVMYQEPGNAVQFMPDPQISQIVRRHIAAALGRPFEWDYLAYPNGKFITQTIEAFCHARNTDK
ncbi:hypothetical protein [Nocardia sp. NPDC051570]|uniref:hypothetical protein n=1 Tax=Nocardia sp. NPDC051570 TaxID=3364324 RepID=UPI00378A18AF